MLFLILTDILIVVDKAVYFALSTLFCLLTFYIMDIHQIIILIIGLCASVVMVIAGLTTHRGKLFMFNACVSALSVAQYLMIGSTAALAVGAIGFVRNSLLAFFSEKYPQVNSTKAVLFFGGTHILAFTLITQWSVTPLSWYEFLPLTGALIGTTAPLFKNMIIVKSLFILCGVNWLTFEIIKGAYGQVFGEILTLGANITAVIYLTIQHRKLGANVPDDAIEDLGTHIIDVITTPVEILRTGTIRVASSNPPTTPIKINV